MKPRVELKQRAEAFDSSESYYTRSGWSMGPKPAVLYVDGVEFVTAIPSGAGQAIEINTAAERLVEEFKKL